jgi:predicted transposase YbfD/YdcC
LLHHLSSGTSSFSSGVIGSSNRLRGCGGDILENARKIASDQINDPHRIEIRECWTLTDEQYLTYLPQRDDWRDLCTVVKVRRERCIDDQTQDEVGYYISCFDGSAAQHLHAIRHHWHIENCLHWVLDIAFREDAARVRTGHGAENLAVLRHIALNLLKREASVKAGIKAKRLQAGWDNRYLLRVLQS